jgi:hypothetical protein
MIIVLDQIGIDPLNGGIICSSNLDNGSFLGQTVKRERNKLKLMQRIDLNRRYANVSKKT